jgi:hypothetical protein
MGKSLHLPGSSWRRRRARGFVDLTSRPSRDIANNLGTHVSGLSPPRPPGEGVLQFGQVGALMLRPPRPSRGWAVNPPSAVRRMYQLC